jgi:purine-binding chemotaxis protein CheW
MMPSFIRGVINLRGRVLPVVDLGARFGQGCTSVARRTSIVVVQTAGRTADGADVGGANGIGIMVDAVNKVVYLSDEDVQPPPAFGAGIKADFISGMAKYEGEFVIILDIDKILPIEELSSLAREAAIAQEGAGNPADGCPVQEEQVQAGQVQEEQGPEDEPGRAEP